jgi:peptide/nickel transport system ATP-binding protein
MRHGQLVDNRAVDAFGADDIHPYTRELMAASPAPVG